MRMKRSWHWQLLVLSVLGVAWFFSPASTRLQISTPDSSTIHALRHSCNRQGTAAQPGGQGLEHWQPFFRGSDVEVILEVPSGQLLSRCQRMLRSNHSSGTLSVGHTDYEHEMATPLSTLAQIQHAGPQLKVCLVRKDCPECQLHQSAASVHVDPPMVASAELCSNSDLIERVMARRMMEGRGFNILAVCPEQAVDTWCQRDADTKARCDAYQVHSLPQEVPVVVAVQNAYITRLGHAYVDQYVLKPVGACNARIETVPSGSPERHKEVVVATAYWGENFYHAIIENLPRLMVVWDDVIARPEVLIAAGPNKAMAGYLEYLGISKDRIKSGDMMADIAYIPNPGGCGTSPGYRYIRELRQRMQRALLAANPGLVQAGDSIVIIQRTGSRSMQNHDELVTGIQKRFPTTKLEVFKDNPAPSVAELARMFYTSKAIVAPHGAGLSNMVLASEAAVVIEVIINPVVTCYMDLVRELGNRWYGVYGGGDMRVNVEEVLQILSQA